MENRKHKIENLISDFSLVKHRLIESLYGEKEITQSQWLVITLLRRQELGIKQIAEKMGITSSAATQLVGSLVRKGYLMRKSAKKDKRAVKIRLSKLAEKKVATRRKKINGKLEKLFKVLDEKEFLSYCRLNQKIANGAKDGKT